MRNSELARLGRTAGKDELEATEELGLLLSLSVQKLAAEKKEGERDEHRCRQDCEARSASEGEDETQEKDSLETFMHLNTAAEISLVSQSPREALQSVTHT